ncbi:MAG TPA: hypothetical protein DEB40_00105 [Elusimicrobia bacterium]|nr:hypothetical protein [Elusimicrobiota bacterium]HBT60135.1 hypothetical protein [Elusimicrobiota bacterium]
MTFLITGGRGFLAGHLAAELRRRRPGARVARLDHVPGPGIITCDLRDPAAAGRAVRRVSPAVIFHLAGTTLARPWDELWATFANSTVNLLEAVRSLPRPERVRVVTAGSSAEYGAAAGGLLTEDFPPRPLTLYGAMKLSQSLTALSYRHAGLDVVVARIANLVGPGMPENLALGTFARQLARIKRGSQPPLIKVGNLRSSRDLIDVRDAARALAMLAERGVSGEIYNVSSGAAVSTGAMLRRLMTVAGIRAQARGEASRRRRGEALHVACSYRKLRRLTGWRPRLSLERTLRDTYDWALARAAQPAGD